MNAYSRRREYRAHSPRFGPSFNSPENENENAGIALDCTKVFLCDAADRISHAGKNAINAFAEGDEQRMMLMGLKRFTKTDSYNTKEARRRIAAKLLEEQKYFF